MTLIVGNQAKIDVPNALKKSFRKAAASVIQVLDSKPRRFSMEDLHQFRVGIKKIMASLDLLRATKKNFDSPHYFKPLKKLFANAGKLRTIQVEKTLLKENGLINGRSAYVKSLAGQEQKKRIRFYKAIRPGIVRKVKTNTRKVTHLLSKLHEKDILKYLAHESRRLEKTLKKYGPDESKLHIIRKKLKTFFLIAKSVVSKERLASLNVLQDLLGKWHDRQIVFGQLVKVVSTCKLKPAELEHLNIVKGQLLAEKEKLFNEILTDINFKPLPSQISKELTNIF